MVAFIFILWMVNFYVFVFYIEFMEYPNISALDESVNFSIVYVLLFQSIRHDFLAY